MAARLSSTLLRTQTDRRLVAMAAQGSEPAFEALVERYRKPLQAYCRRMLLPAEAAEDVVQQAFLSTWQALQRDTQVQDAKAWLYRVTHNAALNALKRSGYDHDQLDEALHGAGAPEDDLERRIAVRQTLTGLAELPDLQREALLRTAVAGQSHEDVARALGLTGGAVRGLVYRARTTLRTAATALTPAPVAQWAASAGGTPDAPLTERIAELVAGGGTAGATALLFKGGATLIAAGTLAGGAVVVDQQARDRPRGDDRVEQRAAAVEGAAPAAPLGADPTSVARRGIAGPAVTLTTGERRRAGRLGEREDGSRRAERIDGERSGPGSGDSRDDDRSGSSDDDDDERPDSSGPGPGSDDDDRSDSSGPGSGTDDDDRSGSSGSGSGSDDPPGDDSSGSGSGSDDPPGDDSSGSGSGSDDPPGDDSPEPSGSGSGSGGSGSGDDDPPAVTVPEDDPIEPAEADDD